jgi:glutamate-ammonia-ligase adenylyltransferase
MASVSIHDGGPQGLQALSAYSRYVQRIRRRYAAELALLPPGAIDADAVTALVQRLREAGRELPSALRVARQLCLERLACLDVDAAAPLDTVTHGMTALAEATLELALAHALADAESRHGEPLDAQGRRIEFWIVGMGKLGGRELNVSSDIDLIYVYEDEGETTGPQRISTHEFFTQVAKKLYALIGDTTEDGFVFRVDLALRPNGNSGPPVCSLPMLEHYLQVQGREWERFAWLKSRVVAPRASVANGRALALRELVTPFVYRRYLDYGVFEGLRQLHRKIRDEAQRRAAGRPERANDVKLSRGGIREIEFIVQLMLVVRGGQYPEIRTRSTLRGLQRLSARGLMKVATAARLAECYLFLRRVEHRIQYLDDQQTHLLPTADADLGWIAGSLGLACAADACELLDRLGEVREFVANEFDALLHDGQAPASNGRNGCSGCGGGPLPVDSEALLERLPPELAERVRQWVRQPRVASLRDESKLRLGRLVKRAAECVADGRCNVNAVLRFVDWLEPLLRRESYLALLVERPAVQDRLLRLLGMARWPMQYLMRHPGVIDELADERLRNGRFDPEVFVADLEQVADDLSALADAVLDTTLRWAWALLKQRHREAPHFAVIAYGKLGGKELGYGSDLDVVFLYDDSDEDDKDRAQEVYGAYVRKLITWLTLRTSAGELFDIDTALRPNGGSGLLVTSIEAFERYQLGRGSNTAWTWEHQAITRARFCAGSSDLADRFEGVRRGVITAARDADALREEIRAMREKVRAAHPVKADRYDVKHSPGGMMDVEFAVQYLVLAQGAAHPRLLDNVGNIALLQRAEDCGLLGAGIGHDAADAYRELRRVQHLARLDEQPTHFEPETLAAQSAAVRSLWRAVFD